MMATLRVQISGWASDHADESFAVLDPVYAMLDGAQLDAVILDFNCSQFPPTGEGDGEDREDPTYEFTVAGLKDGPAFAELRRRAYVLASSTGPETIIDCDLE